jgi:hypothetical protein
VYAQVAGCVELVCVQKPWLLQPPCVSVHWTFAHGSTHVAAQFEHGTSIDG